MRQRPSLILKVTCQFCNKVFTMRIKSETGEDRVKCWSCQAPYVALSNVKGGIKMTTEDTYGRVLDHTNYYVDHEEVR